MKPKHTFQVVKPFNGQCASFKQQGRAMRQQDSVRISAFDGSIYDPKLHNRRQKSEFNLYRQYYDEFGL